LLTTHNMDEAEKLCDEIVIMNLGRIIERGQPQELIKKYIGSFTLEVSATGDGAEAAVRSNYDCPSCKVERFGDRVYVYADQSENLTNRIDAVQQYVPVLRPSTLEDVFLKRTISFVRNDDRRVLRIPAPLPSVLP